MSDAGDDEAAPSNAELAGRVDGLESKLDLILGKLGGTEHQAHAAAQQHTEDRLDRPTNIADEIRQQLEERDRAAAASAKDQADQDWRAGVDEKLSGMTEQTPEAPLRRVEKLMGWR